MLMSLRTCVLGLIATGAMAAEFFPVPGQGTQEAARAFCKANGGDLASIHSAAEEAAAREACPNLPCYVGLQKMGDVENDGKDGTWAWLDGTVLDYNKCIDCDSWDTRKKEIVVAIWTANDWHDTGRPDDRNHWGVCRKAEPEPEYCDGLCPGVCKHTNTGDDTCHNPQKCPHGMCDAYNLEEVPCVDGSDKCFCPAGTEFCGDVARRSLAAAPKPAAKPAPKKQQASLKDELASH